MLDWDRINQLRDEVGEKDFDEIIALFLEEVEEVTQRLEADPDLSGLEQDMHFLKSSALTLGFQDFANLCQAAEIDASRGFASDIDIAEILTAFKQSRTTFLQELPERIAA
jgi:HPt (histidine-containing phosphotransfer) domain-containing protein